MSTPLTDSIQNLIDYINGVTGGQDTNLSDAVATLADGYGGYSIDGIASGDDPSGDIVITTTTIEQYAFISCKNIKKITTTNTTTISTSSFNGSGVTEIYMPLVVTIQAQAFAYCYYLEKISLPAISNLTTSVFANCSRLKHIHIPNVRSLGVNTFSSCKELQTISLPSCTSINATTFSLCSALTDIYLPNDESSYTGAPWGATNATVHYNTQFDENGEPILE